MNTYLLQHYQDYLTILFRVSGLFIMAPFFSGETVPFRVKGMMALLFSIALFPIVLPALPPPENDIFVLGARMLGEISFGFILGLVVTLFLSAFQVAGQLYSVQIGFTIVNVFDPLSNSNIPILSQLNNMIGFLLFLILGIHRILLHVLQNSFFIVPVLTLDRINTMAERIPILFSQVFVLGFKLALPIVGTMFLAEMTMGIISKTATSFNILSVGFQIKIFIGFTLILFAVPFFQGFSTNLFQTMLKEMSALIQGAVSGH